MKAKLHISISMYPRCYSHMCMCNVYVYIDVYMPRTAADMVKSEYCIYSWLARHRPVRKTFCSRGSIIILFFFNDADSLSFQMCSSVHVDLGLETLNCGHLM